MDLAASFGQGPVLVGSIAKNQEISGNYIRILLAALKATGLVRAVRGPTGGYELAYEPGKITVLDIVRALEGYSWPVACVARDEWCSRSKKCAARDVWEELAVAMEKVLSEITLEELVARQRAKIGKDVMFHI